MVQNSQKLPTRRRWDARMGCTFLKISSNKSLAISTKCGESLVKRTLPRQAGRNRLTIFLPFLLNFLSILVVNSFNSGSKGRRESTRSQSNVQFLPNNEKMPASSGQQRGSKKWSLTYLYTMLFLTRNGYILSLDARK
jgi:hypothetical protein